MSGWTERACVIRVFRCDCNKMHLCTGVSQATVCACGRNLWALMWQVAR